MSDSTEFTERQLTRNVNELLQEIRVAQAGVQILFGFLFSVMFTNIYQQANLFQHIVHLIAELFAISAVALLTAPAAWHRVLFRQNRRDHILRIANKLAIAGLACLAAAMSATVLLLVDLITLTWIAIIASAVTLASFSFLWFLLPLYDRLRD